MRLAKMLMAYDFDRRLNPFAELGGFVFTFMGDGAPGTGKTTLIQMMAGLIHGYCETAGYPFRYRNLSTDSIDSYQGKSGPERARLRERGARPHGDRLRHHRRHRPARGPPGRPAVERGPARDHGRAHGRLRRREHGGQGQLHLRDVLELPRERGRRAAPARGRALPRGRPAEPRGLRGHPGAPARAQPRDPARGPRPLRRPGDPARRGALLRRARRARRGGPARRLGRGHGAARRADDARRDRHLPQGDPRGRPALHGARPSRTSPTP